MVTLDVPTPGGMPKREVMAFAAIVLLASCLLAVLILPAGVDVTWKDSRQLLAAAHSAATGQGLAIPNYDPAADRVRLVAMTHFPPLTSVAYLVLLVVGVPFEQAPSVVSLLAWPVLLTFLGLTTRKLTGSPALALLSLAWAALCWPFLAVYRTSTTEVLFLPLLAWVGWLLTDLPHSVPSPIRRLTLASVALGLMMVTRYTGPVLFTAVMLWWSLIRLYQKCPKRLLTELPLLSWAVLPLIAWTLRNLWRTASPVGALHSSPSVDGFTDGLVAVAKQSTWLFLPMLRPGSTWRHFGPLAVLLLVVPGLLLVFSLRRLRPMMKASASLMARSPLPAMLAAYVGLYLFVQPLLRFRPLDNRDVTTALVLAYPLLFAVAVSLWRGRSPGVQAPPGPGTRKGNSSRQTWRRWRQALRRMGEGQGEVFFGAALAGHALFATVLMVNLMMQAPGTSPPMTDLADQHLLARQRLLAGHPEWSVSRPPRLGDRRLHHPGLHRILSSLPLGTAVVSNAPDLFPDQVTLATDAAVEAWLAEGRCRGTTPLLVVILDWDVWRANGSWVTHTDPVLLRHAVEERCPSIEVRPTRHAAVYYLPATQ